MSKLKKYIEKLIQEYTGGGSPTHNTTDGNEVPSPRPFADDVEDDDTNPYRPNVTWVPSKSVMDM